MKKVATVANNGARGQQRLGNPVCLARNPTEIPRNPEIQKSNLCILIVNDLYTTDQEILPLEYFCPYTQSDKI